MKLTESQLKQIVKEEISKTLNEVNSASWFVKVGHDKMSVPKKQAENAVQALELAILNRLNHPEISDKMKKTIVDYYMERSYTVVDLSTGDKHKNIQVSDSFLKTNKDLLDKYSPILEGRNNMKLTESQLRKIIREELEAMRKGDPSLFRSIAMDAKVSLDPRGPSALDRARGVKGLAPAQIERFNDIVNQVQRGELERDEAVEMIKDMVHGTMDEAADDRAMENADLVNMLSDEGIISLRDWKGADKGARRKALMRLRGAYGNTASKLRAAVENEDSRDKVKALLKLR